MIRSVFTFGAGILLLAGTLAATSSLAEDKPIEKPAYITKSTIEKPAKALLAGTFVNPKVAPGKVRWHTDFSIACETSKKSGKPVLLFQMMGKLDDQFC